MHIDITRPASAGLKPLTEGEDEVWIRVQDDEVLDWQDVKDALPQPWRYLLSGIKSPSRYIPDKPAADELDKGQFVDWWIVWATKGLTEEMEKSGV